jgi:rod shape determining protein RodA
MSYGGLGVSLLAFLFSAFVIPFNVCWVLLAVCILDIMYLAGLAIYYQSRNYVLITLFAVLSTGMYYVCDTVLDHLADHQRTRIEVLLGKKEDLRGAGYNVNQAKIAIGSGGWTG